MLLAVNVFEVERRGVEDGVPLNSVAVTATQWARREGEGKTGGVEGLCMVAREAGRRGLDASIVYLYMHLHI